MAEIKWIKITTNMFEDEKIGFIESLPEADSILVIWIKLLTQAGKMNESGFIFLTDKIPYTDEMLAHKFRRPLNVVRMALETFKKLEMIDYDEQGFLKISNWEKHQSIDKLDKIREDNKRRVQEYRKRQKLTETKGENALPEPSDEACNVTVMLRNADVTQQTKTKTKNKTNILDDFFEEIWSLYPKKIGKGSISTTQKKKLYGIGLENMTKAIENYKKEIEVNKTDKQYIKNGSTFFNSGYVDYLPESDYMKEKQQMKKTTRKYEPMFVTADD